MQRPLRRYINIALKTGLKYKVKGVAFIVIPTGNLIKRK